MDAHVARPVIRELCHYLLDTAILVAGQWLAIWRQKSIFMRRTRTTVSNEMAAWTTVVLVSIEHTLGQRRPQRDLISWVDRVSHVSGELVAAAVAGRDGV